MDVQALQQANEESSRVLAVLRSEIFLFAVLLRDYLLERSPNVSNQQRRVLEDLRRSAQNHIQTLQEQWVLKDRPEVQRLRNVIEDYWRAAEPVFGWLPAQKAAEGPGFLRQRVAPQRQAVFQLASEIENVSSAQSRLRQQEIVKTQEDLKSYLRHVAAAALLLGAVVALVSIVRTRSLEASAALHLRQIERDAQDLRRLSLRLSKAQEDERKSISRELHDQVGQMLTALRMELGNIEEFRQDAGGGFAEHMAGAKKLAEETLRTVRDISMGLRPSVLDELGLGPALKWQAREFTRRSSVPVEIQIDGSLDRLADTHRTCVYRVVQEALTNCARHARASQIRITVHGGAGTIAVTVEDNGVGFDVPAARSRGLGLLGAEERVRELGGRIEILSRPSKGALLRCEVPASTEVAV
ncbi:MAG: sensor histidine kinase [Acidobacteria bacterium]|nr:sensor histidine kinase [Acidobacteriota bacterium]